MRSWGRRLARIWHHFCQPEPTNKERTLKANLFSIVFLAVVITAAVSTASADSITYNGSLAAPGFYNGTGNPNSGFTVDTVGNLELGLGAIIRFVGPITPTPANSNVYDAPVGTSGGDALWDWEFSVNTQAGGGSNTLASYTSFEISILDVGTGISNMFNPEIIPDNSYYGTSGKTVGSPAPAGSFGMPHSENNSFTGFLPGFNPNANDTYDYSLLAFQGSTVVATDTMQVVVGTGAAVPEPKVTVLLGFLLAGMGVFGWRKRRTVSL
jgi:hypothetical protein